MYKSIIKRTIQTKQVVAMKTGEIRSHRLNFLLQKYLKGLDDRELVLRIKQIGVSNATAKDYFNTVRAMALKIAKAQERKQLS